MADRLFRCQVGHGCWKTILRQVSFYHIRSHMTIFTVNDTNKVSTECHEITRLNLWVLAPLSDLELVQQSRHLTMSDRSRIRIVSLNCW